MTLVARLVGCMLLSILGVGTLAHAQLLGEPPLPARDRKARQRPANLEWMWQYGPPPVDGREHELLQDPSFPPFLDEYFRAPQSFWGPAPTDPKSPQHKSLATTVYDFLAIPGKVIADDNRYMTVTGSVFRVRTSRGLVFADLNAKNPLVLFAAIDWIRESHATDEPDAEYTLWLFPNQAPGPSQQPDSLPPAVLRSLTRWMAEPVAGTSTVQKITAAILVMPDGTPHQIPVPGAGKTEPTEAPPLAKRPSS